MSAEWLKLWKDAWEDGVSAGRYAGFSTPGMPGGAAIVAGAAVPGRARWCHMERLQP